MGIGFIIILFIVCVGGCWLIFSSIGKALFPDENKSTFVDKSVHHHHYHVDNRSVHINGDEFKGLKK